jgi:hypothetical protein
MPGHHDADRHTASTGRPSLVTSPRDLRD